MSGADVGVEGVGGFERLAAVVALVAPRGKVGLHMLLHVLLNAVGVGAVHAHVQVVGALVVHAGQFGLQVTAT